jgi:SAM-dependent methyltransferase
VATAARFRRVVYDLLAKRSVHLRRLLWARGQRRSAFVSRYLGDLRGIEIGGSAHNDFGIEAVNVDQTAAMDTIYKQEEWQLSGRRRPVDIVAPGDNLPFEDDAVDFVFASHVIEHFPDPIRALKEWLRVARKYVVVVVPHRDRTFDSARDLSSVDELIERHEQSLDSTDDKHWTVWTLASFLELCERLDFGVVDSCDPDDKVGNGFIVVLEATERRA